jgi:serine/threonine protein kinase
MLPGSVPVGRRIGNRYRIEGYLGGGANGHVYQVWDEIQEQRVALKLMDRTPPALVWTEAKVLTGLRGDFILPILNADEEAGVPFIVTEIMRNGTCHDAAVTGVGVEVERATRWVQQASVGASRIHDLGLLHNDIKPENLFLDGNDNVLVGDLGLSCLMDANGRGHPAGTDTTMAPEVISGAATTVRTDVYSLGATLYELLAGHHLNPNIEVLKAAGAGYVDIYDEIINHVPTAIGEVVPHVPVGLRQVIMKAVAPDPADRYRTPAEFAAAIGARTRLQRTWNRTQPCSGHTTCFLGVRPGASTFQVCAVPTGVRDKHEVQAHRVPAGTRINQPPWKTVTRAQLAKELRTRMRDLT